MPINIIIHKGEKMKNTKKRICLLLCIVALIASAMPVQAASKASQAKKAYNSFLSQKTVNWNSFKINSDKLNFHLLDINGDKIPELYIYAGVPNSMGPKKIYEFYNGKMREFRSYGRIDFYKYYPSKKVIVDYVGVKSYNTYVYYSVKPGKEAIPKISKGTYKDGPMTYNKWVNGEWKQISKSSFDKELKKLIGNAKGYRVPEFNQLHKNTKANRLKYLR